MQLDRCDFSSIMTCLKNHISESNQMSQPEFLYEIFEDFMDSPESKDFSFDNGLVCRWMTGQAKISPKISTYYVKPSKQEKLAETIQQNLLPLMTDCSKATYYNHILTLFSLYSISQEQQDIMRDLCFLPPAGISARIFADWLGQTTLNDINDLIETGFIQANTRHTTSLHPMIQEIALSETRPSVTKGNNHGTSSDRALLLDYQATMETKPEKTIKLGKEALAQIKETTDGNAHLVSNLHANFGGLYRINGQTEFAKGHMEKGILLLEQYKLLYTNDSIPQINNYAA